MWIAFNLITFVDITQPYPTTIPKSYSCELLSIWLLLWISHSWEGLSPFVQEVVNCFQFDYFCGYHTAILWNSARSLWLWIAFNLITFVDITQQVQDYIKRINRCELLSIWLLLWISHSPQPILVTQKTVVNCFQFDYFCGYHTAFMNKYQKVYSLWIAFNLITFVDITQQAFDEDISELELWIAFNLITFVDITQQRKNHRDLWTSCELLSIWLLLWISHSPAFQRRASVIVVNCFQFDYFCGYHTAIFLWIYPVATLWIAFNLITFVDITQRPF